MSFGRFQIRRDTTAEWTANNPVLAEGEFAYDLTTGELYVGDGSTAWSGLTPIIPAGFGTVTSVGLAAPAGFAVSGSPVSGSGTLSLSFAAGYALPTTAKQAQWDAAYGWGDHAAAGYLTGVAWGDIGGTLADQSDLQAALAAAGSSGWTDLASSTPGSVNQVTFTGISQDYGDLLIVLHGVSPDTSDNLQIAISGDSGGTWSSGLTIDSVNAGHSDWGGVLILDYTSDGGLALREGGSANSDPAWGSGSAGSVGWRCSGGINAVRLSWATGTTNFDAGTIRVKAR